MPILHAFSDEAFFHALMWVDQHSFPFLFTFFLSSFHYFSWSYYIISVSFFFHLAWCSFWAWHSHLNLAHYVSVLYFFLLHYQCFHRTPLSLWIMRLFTHRISCMGYEFDYRVFESSFLLFLLPYYLSLHYVLCLTTTLRSWDQTLYLTISTWVVFED